MRYGGGGWEFEGKGREGGVGFEGGKVLGEGFVGGGGG